jgi:hypothetical protein
LLLCVRAKNLVTKISCNLGGILSIKTGVFWKPMFFFYSRT